MPGTLYLIPCPIAEEGDVWDVLPAANRAVMASLDYFIVENTRSARRFLSKAKLGRPIEELEFRELNEHTVAGCEVEELVAPIAAGRSAGVISEAGVPGVADPGALNGQSFAFNGYLPVKPDERTRAIRAFERRAREGQAQLFIETPYRNVKLAEQLLQLCAPQTMLTVACDLTAPGETILTRSVADWRRSRLPELNRRPAIFILG